MRMHLEAIDNDLWHVAKTGVPKVGEGVAAADVKRFVQLAVQGQRRRLNSERLKNRCSSQTPFTFFFKTVVEN